MDQNGNFGRYSLQAKFSPLQENELYKQINNISEFVYTKMSKVVLSKIIKCMELTLEEELQQQGTSLAECAFRGKRNGQPSCFLQMSAGKNFWAAAHTDSDYTLSAVVAISRKAQNKTMELFGETGMAHRNRYTEEDVAFHFVFPQYGKAIPMRHGDVLFFNPAVLHCASRPQFDDVYSFALYTSQKTVMHANRLNTNKEAQK